MGVQLDQKGYQKTEIGVIPKDWCVKRLKDIAEINKESLKGNTDKEYKFYYYDLSSVNKGKLLKPTEKIQFKNAPSRARRVFKRNNILMSTVRPYLQGFAYIDFESDDCICSTGFAVISGERPSDIKYIYHNLFSYTITNQIQRLLVGSNYPAINTEDVENLKIPYPNNKNERAEIASILSTWDKAIELKEKLIEQKKQQKKGLMQKLLTGEVRLPGFDGEWEQVRLGELAKLQGGYAFKSSMFKEKGIPIVRISNILPEITDYNQEFVYYDEIKISDNFMVQYGDILIAMSGATTGKVGIYKKNEIAYLNQRVGKFVNLDKSKLDYGYLYYLVTSTKFKTQLTEELATGAQPNISSKQIENFKFKIPSINEQISISKILAQFDKFISLQEKELIYLKQQKKGLMQLLLTGKVRVKV